MSWHRAILHLLPAIVAGLIMFAASNTGAQNNNDTAGQVAKVHVIQVKGAIGVGTGVMMAEALENASEAGALLLVIELDTPGGLVAATREIIQSILAIILFIYLNFIVA